MPPALAGGFFTTAPPGDKTQNLRPLGIYTLETETHTVSPQLCVCVYVCVCVCDCGDSFQWSGPGEMRGPHLVLEVVGWILGDNALQR